MFIFLKNQILQIKRNGKNEFLRKLKILLNIIFDFLIILFLFILFFPFYIILLIFGYKVISKQIICWRLGHFAGNSDFFISNIKYSLKKKNYYFIWYLPCKSCNLFFENKLRKKLTIVPFYIGRTLNIISDIFFINPVDTDRDLQNLMDRTPANFTFSKQENNLGKDYLKSQGLSSADKFVCLNVRDNSYLKKYLPWWDWSYHDYRNGNIDDYIDAAEALTKLGYYVFRMGAIVDKKLTTDNPKIIDYASSSHRSDFLDIFLGANCTFAISTGSGFDAIPYIFRKPILFIDYAPIALIFSFSKKFMVAPKRIWSKKLNRLLSLSEYFKTGVSYELSGNKIKNYSDSLSYRSSSKQEICKYTLDMHAYINKKLKLNSKDKNMQKKFWDIFEKDPLLHGDINAIISPYYLRKNKLMSE